MKKHHIAILILATIGMAIILSFIPPHEGRSQKKAVLPVQDTVKPDSQTIKNKDTINSLISVLDKKLTPPTVVVKEKIRDVVIHDTVAVHDTVYVQIIKTKHVAVPDKHYYDKHVIGDNYKIVKADSIIKADSLKQLKKRHGFIFFKKRNK